MAERRGTKGLELWCRRMTEGYPGVNVVNMTTSWRDGLAFCAIIHHFRPDLIEFSKLNKDDIYYNNELAFRTAEKYLGIPALLEPEDMVEFPVPDRLSILTYLSQFYQTFVVSQGSSPSRIAPKRPSSSPEKDLVSSPSTSPPSKVTTVRGKIKREPCAKCNLPVFLAERLNVGKLLFHRTCFRCARCSSQLTLANYYETENNEFCCETCPDEEVKHEKQQQTTTIAEQQQLLSRSLSDEEKSANLITNADDYSAKFENDLENINDSTLKRTFTLKARNFIQSQLDNDQKSDKTSSNSDKDDDDGGGGGNSGCEDDKPPDLPKTLPPCDDKSPLDSSKNLNPSNTSDVCFSKSELGHNSDSGIQTSNIDSPVNNDRIISDSDNFNENNLQMVKSHFITKDNNNKIISAEGNDVENISLVKARMRLFEIKAVQNVIDVPSNNEDKLSSISPLSTKSHEESETKDKENEQKTELKDPEESVITISDSTEESYEIVSDEKSPITANSSSIIEILDISTITNESKIEYPDDLNPFDDQEERDDIENKQHNFDIPQPAIRTKLKTTKTTKVEPEKSYNPFEDDEDNEGEEKEEKPYNPFDEDDDDDEEPVKPQRKLIKAPKISLTFPWNMDRPVPKPRTSITSTPEPKPRNSGLSLNSIESSSSSSPANSVRKKKPAPRPPILTGYESGQSSVTSSPCHSVTHSPRSTPKYRKARKAPLPPPISSKNNENAIVSSPTKSDEDFSNEKIAKDEQNRNRQSQQYQSPTSSETSSTLSSLSTNVPNKSTYGKWKRRKGQAPSRPIPQRRIIKSIPMTDVKRELELIEIQQQGLEKQGVRLEQMIREKSEGNHQNDGGGGAGAGGNEEALEPEVEDLILQLFELVNEKNELFRKQTELMYLRRQHRLEEEHAEVEYQIRCLMLQPEANKTDFDKEREDELIKRLVEIVERRNEIIECLEMDRLREAEEDDSITNHLTLYNAKKEVEEKNSVSSSSSNSAKIKMSKHKKMKDKIKQKLKGGHKVDADKDVDESEEAAATTTKVIKEKKEKKKKFNIF